MLYYITRAKDAAAIARLSRLRPLPAGRTGGAAEGGGLGRYSNEASRMYAYNTQITYMLW